MSVEIIDFMRHADRLQHLPRTGWLMSRVPQPESVAAHTYGVVLAAMLVADAVLARPEPPAIDRAKVLGMAVLHDIAEAITTDIPAPVKRFVGRDVIKDAERKAAAHLLAPFDDYMALWEEYEDNTSIEANIVHAADRIQMMVKVLQYETAGVGDLRRFWLHESNFKDYGLPEVAAIFARLKKYHGESDWPVEDF